MFGKYFSSSGNQASEKVLKYMKQISWYHTAGFEPPHPHPSARSVAAAEWRLALTADTLSS
jgi:hypothetical protein